MAETYNPMTIRINTIAELDAVKQTRAELQALQNQVPMGTDLWNQLQKSIDSLDGALDKVANKTLPETGDAAEGLNDHLEHLHMAARMMGMQLGELGHIFHAFSMGGEAVGILVAVGAAFRMLSEHAKQAADQIASVKEQIRQMATLQLQAINEVLLARQQADAQYLASLKSTITDELAEISKEKDAAIALYKLESDGRKKSIEDTKAELDAEIDLRGFEEGWTKEQIQSAHEANRIGAQKKTSAEEDAQDQAVLNKMVQDYLDAQKRLQQNINVPQASRASPEYQAIGVSIADKTKQQDLNAERLQKLQADAKDAEEHAAKLEWAQNVLSTGWQHKGYSDSDFDAATQVFAVEGLKAVGSFGQWGAFSSKAIDTQTKQAKAMRDSAQLLSDQMEFQDKKQLADLVQKKAEMDAQIKQIEEQNKKDLQLTEDLPALGMSRGQAAIKDFKSLADERRQQRMDAETAATKTEAVKAIEDFLKEFMDARMKGQVTPSQVGEAGVLMNPPRNMQGAITDAEAQVKWFELNPPGPRDIQGQNKVLMLLGRMIALQELVAKDAGTHDPQLDDFEARLNDVETKIEHARWTGGN